MRHGYTLFFLAWGGVLILMALVKLVQGKALSGAAGMGCMGLIGIALAAGTWYFVGWQQRLASERLAQAAVVEQPKMAARPPADIVTTPPVEGAALARQMTGHLRTALGVWLGAVVLLSVAGILLLRDFKYALTAGLLRFGALFWKCLLLVLVAEAVLWLAHYGWVNDEPGPGWFSKVVNIAFGAVPVALVVLGAVSLLSREDPWQALPGGPPFALREFAARHPQLRIETVGILGGDIVEVTCGASPRVIFSVWDLRGNELAWEKCTDASEPERLGGPPPFPGSRCLARLRIRQPDYDAVTDEDLDRGVVPPDIHNVRYVYNAGGADTTEVTAHFEKWAKSAGSDTNVYGYRRYFIEVTAGGKAWAIQVRGRKYTVDDVYVEYSDKLATPAQTKEDE